MILDTLLAEQLPPQDVSAAVLGCYHEIRRSIVDDHRFGFRPEHPFIRRYGAGRECIYELENLLSTDECRRIIDLGRSALSPSTILGPDDPAYVRTSQTSQVGATGDSLIMEVEQRVCDVLGLRSLFSEPLQLHLYHQGQFFNDHTDYLPKALIHAFDPCFGQRTYSVLIYLNDVVEGGETVFPKLGLSFAARTGRALIWNNLLPDGRPNSRTMHRGDPVERGFKAVLTKWFRLPTEDMFDAFPREPVPKSKFSFRVGKLSDGTLAKVQEWVADETPNVCIEEGCEEFLKCEDVATRPSHLIPLPTTLSASIVEEARGAVYPSRGEPAVEGLLYGVRRYNPGAWLAMHFDRQQPSHEVGFMLCVDRTNREKWPLVIEDLQRNLHEVELDPGEYLIYAASCLLHGRPRALKSGNVWNLYVHFPVGAGHES